MAKEPKKAPDFAREADLCAAFVAALARPRRRYEPEVDDWIVYPETADFDLLLVRRSDGAQIGVEAKLRLNPQVVCQALPDWKWAPVVEGPDYRAVLVPWSATDLGMGEICAALGITVIRVSPTDIRGTGDGPSFSPLLPVSDRRSREREWFEWCPDRRCKLPDYVPDVAAGVAAPTKLTEWKIAAIKLAIIMTDRPATRADFVALDLSPSRWMQNPGAWLQKVDGGWLPGPYMPDFRKQHPVNFAQIEADKAAWMPPGPAVAATAMKQAALL